MIALSVSFPRLRQRVAAQATDGNAAASSAPGFLGMTIGEIRTLVQQASMPKDTFTPTAKPEAPKPEAPKAEAPKAPATGSYTVRSGDTLWKIAQQQLGDGHRWKEIYEANKGILQDPNKIVPGMTLAIPGAKTEAPKAQANEAKPVSHATLRQGSNGAGVRTLQEKLKAHGFDPGPIDGDFGPKTLAAVKAFQTKHGLEADGIVGPKTWGKLDGTEAKPSPKPDPAPSVGSGPTLRQGTRGEPVKKLQARLKELGFDPGPLDGDFGPKTLAAVKAFQAKHGLEADGVVGPKTWGKLGIKVEGKVETDAPAPSKNGPISGSKIAQGAYKLHQSGYRYPPNLTTRYYHSPGKVGCCADFVCDSIRETGFDIGGDMKAKGYNPHYCPSMIQYFKKYEQLRSPSQPMQPGDIVFFDWDGGGQRDPDHVAVVTKVDASGRPTELAESRHFGARTEITSIRPGDRRSRCIVGVGRV